MTNLQTIRNFHWITKIVILLTGLLVGLLLIALVVSAYWMSNQADTNALRMSSGLGAIIMSLAWILTQAFLLILIVIAVYMAAVRVKAWIEKYLDSMLAKLDVLAEQKSGREEAGLTLAVMNGKVERMEKKLDNIERILENVSE